MSAAFKIIAPGLSTTVQDAGRIGYQRFGVPVSGALDRIALAAANCVVGNAAYSAALEMLYQGIEFEVRGECLRIAVAGANARLEIRALDSTETRRVAMLESVCAMRGERVRVVLGGPSISAYLAIEGGVDVPVVMGSRSTYVRAAFGGFDGRALQAGDEIAVGAGASGQRSEQRLAIDLDPPTRVRIVAGPQDDYFSAAALVTLVAEPYRVSPASDRMGLRLNGERLEHTKGYNIISDGIAPGAIQVPGDALPIVLMSDRQTTGGYPKIATVISADMPLLGRLGPGAMFQFEWVELAVAEAARRALDRAIAGWPSQRTIVSAAATVDLARLLDANLVSGVVSAADDGPTEDIGTGF